MEKKKQSAQAVGQQKFRYLFEQLDGFHANHTETDEWKLASAVADGNVDEVTALLLENEAIDYEIIDNNQFKTYEYLAVSTVAVVTRIAILSGMNGAAAYRLSDVYLQRIGECKNVLQLQTEQGNCILEFTREIQRLSNSQEHNRLVEQGKKFIEDHIYEPISLSDVADYLSVSASYLGRLFRRCDGVTVGDYIRIRKMETAKQSLVYSDKSILEIANYFGFPSQSYFAKQFKTVTGMTPMEFRNRFGHLNS